ncbi:MAG: hypothetical protein ACI4GO_07030 [Hominenteromicrobium sp.]
MLENVRKLMKSGKLTYILIGVCVLAAFVIILWPSGKADSATETALPEPVETDAEAYSAALSERIAQMVSAITGESDPHVTVTLKSMGETVYATEDRQSEKNAQEYAGDSLNKTQTDGDTEKTYILVKSADGSQKPLIVTKTEPEIRGVVIVSERGNDVQIREKITEAVKTALDLSSTQVCVTGRSEYT